MKNPFPNDLMKLIWFIFRITRQRLANAKFGEETLSTFNPDFILQPLVPGTKITKNLSIRAIARLP